MENRIKVAVDAMGGDYAPLEAVKGAVAAVQEKENVEVLLVGQKEVLEKQSWLPVLIQKTGFRLFQPAKSLKQENLP